MSTPNNENIHMRAKWRFLEANNLYECCGAVWKNGQPCLGRYCPVEAERQRRIMEHAKQVTQTPADRAAK